VSAYDLLELALKQNVALRADLADLVALWLRAHPSNHSHYQLAMRDAAATLHAVLEKHR
jgi:hypothetical protein